MLAGLRRIAIVLGASALVVGLPAALIGLALGASLTRSVSVAYYVVGAFLVVLGFFAGSRGPLRPRGSDDASDPVTGLFGMGIATRGARVATEGERKDSIATAGMFLTVGIWLIALGIAVDGSAGFL
jgi:hypothetical protein